MSENNISRAQIVYKNRSGIELTSEERIYSLEMEIGRLDNLIRDLSESFIEHQIGLTKDEPNPVGINDIIIGNVKFVYYIKEYEYKGKILEQFLITLEDDSKFYMDKIKGTQPKVEDGDTISYKIDGDKLREVRVLYDV